jgi:cyclopropane fatty-acyl-phospholipid synthase-like methyltransferase
MAEESERNPEPIIVSIASGEKGRVLDLGCGRGRHTIHLAKRGFHVTAIDNDANAIDQLTERAWVEGIHSRVTLIHRPCASAWFSVSYRR